MADMVIDTAAAGMVATVAADTAAMADMAGAIAIVAMAAMGTDVAAATTDGPAEMPFI
jgi:hypothetical protein